MEPIEDVSFKLKNVIFIDQIEVSGGIGLGMAITELWTSIRAELREVVDG